MAEQCAGSAAAIVSATAAIMGAMRWFIIGVLGSGNAAGVIQITRCNTRSNRLARCSNRQESARIQPLW
jgi:hypothetical protein